MLKHVHSSPHRSSSTSIRRNVVDLERIEGHFGQISSSSLCLTCSSTENPKFSPSRANSPITIEDSRVPPVFSDSHKNTLNTSDKERLDLSSSSLDLQPVRLRTVSEPSAICPKCFKKKRKPTSNQRENVKNIESVKEEEKSTHYRTTTLVLDPTLLLPTKDSGKDSSFSHDSVGPRCSTPIESRCLVQKSSHLRNEVERVTSSATSSPSQSPTSSVASSSKSPFLGSKERRIKHEDKLFRGRLDNLSLDSSMSCSTSSREDTLCSLSSSAISLPDNLKQTMVRVWVRCLMQEMEYKTICLSYGTTCRQVVHHLLSKFRMRHRDPNLFYLAMEVTIKKAGAEVRTCLRLDETSFPAQLVECHPKEYSRLALRMRRGGLIRIYDYHVSEGSHYKSLLVEEKISCLDVMALVLACNKVTENINNFALVEVWPRENKEKILRPDDEPMVIASEWEDKEAVRFEMRRISNSTNHNSTPQDDVTPSNRSSFSRIRLDNEGASNATTHGGNTTNINNASNINKDHIQRADIIDNRDFEDEQRESEEGPDQGGLSELSSEASLASLSKDLSNPTSSPLQSNGSTDNKYVTRLKAKIDRGLSQTESKYKRKLPKTPNYISKITGSLLLNENLGPTGPHSSKIAFKTYNDYENYFYI